MRGIGRAETCCSKRRSGLWNFKTATKLQINRLELSIFLLKCFSATSSPLPSALPLPSIPLPSPLYTSPLSLLPLRPGVPPTRYHHERFTATVDYLSFVPYHQVKNNKQTNKKKDKKEKRGEESKGDNERI